MSISIVYQHLFIYLWQDLCLYLLSTSIYLYIYDRIHVYIYCLPASIYISITGSMSISIVYQHLFIYLWQDPCLYLLSTSIYIYIYDRIYVHHSDALLRFCPEKYLPFDAANKNKYVVGDDYLPSWQIPSFSKYMQTMGFSFTDTLNTYIRSDTVHTNQLLVGQEKS